MPFAPQMLSFFRNQVSVVSAHAGARAGEGFYPLLSVRQYVLPSYWGLTPSFWGQRYSGTYDWYAVVLASVLTAAALAGLFLLLRRRRWSLPLFVLGMTTGYIFCLARLHYPYAAYKVLVLSWFSLAYIVVVAAERGWEMLARQSSKNAAYAGAAIGSFLLLTVVGFFFLQQQVFYNSLPFKSVREFKRVAVVENFASGQPLALIVDEQYANSWASHFLRNSKLYFAQQYRGYMAGQKFWMDRSSPIDLSDIRYVVTDNEKTFNARRLMSKLGPYYVWDWGQQPWVMLADVKSALGVQTGEGNAWNLSIGKSSAEVEVVSRTATLGLLSADFTLTGGSAENALQQRVRVETDSGDLEEERVITSGMHSFLVQLHPGLNQVSLQPAEKAPLVVNVSHLQVSAVPHGDAVEIRDIENPNTIESWEGDPFFWAGRRDTVINLFATKAGIAELTGTLMPGPSLVDKLKARLEIASPTGAKAEEDLDWGHFKIDVPVNAGLNTIFMQSIGPTVAIPSDPRTMMVGFRNLQVSYLEEKSKK